MWSRRLTFFTALSPAEVERTLAGMTVPELSPEAPGVLYGEVGGGHFRLAPAPNRLDRRQLPLVAGPVAVGRVEARPEGGSVVRVRVVPRANHVVAVVLFTLVVLGPVGEGLARAASFPPDPAAIWGAVRATGSLIVAPLLPPLGLALYVRFTARPLLEVVTAALLATGASPPGESRGGAGGAG